MKKKNKQKKLQKKKNHKIKKITKKKSFLSDRQTDTRSTQNYSSEPHKIFFCILNHLIRNLQNTQTQTQAQT